MYVQFIDYNTMKEFYTVPEVCSLLKMSEPTLREKCKRHGIYSIRRGNGNEIFLKYAVCHLHNILYHMRKKYQKGRTSRHGKQ